LKNDNTYSAEVLGTKNVCWNLQKSIYNKILRLFETLESSESDSVEQSSSEYLGCNVSNSSGESIVCFQSKVLKISGNLIEYKFDKSKSIENEILKTIPNKLSKKVLPFIHKNN